MVDIKSLPWRSVDKSNYYFTRFIFNFNEDRVYIGYNICFHGYWMERVVDIKDNASTLSVLFFMTKDGITR